MFLLRKKIFCGFRNENMQKMSLLSSPCLSVYLSVGNICKTAERIFIKFDTEQFY
jgi:hypothetical protein